MAERVVDVLELVEIDEQRRAGRSRAAVAGQQLLDPVHDQRPVRQAGQRVVQRLVAQLAGPLTDELRRARSRPVPKHETSDRPEQHAQRDPGDQQLDSVGSPNRPLPSTAAAVVTDHPCVSVVVYVCAARQGRDRW